MLPFARHAGARVGVLVALAAVAWLCSSVLWSAQAKGAPKSPRPTTHACSSNRGRGRGCAIRARARARQASKPVGQPTTWDPSGQPMPAGDIPGWHQVFADNFANDNVPVGAFSGCSWPTGRTIAQMGCTGLAAYPDVQAKWGAYPDGSADTSHNGTYYPSRTVSIKNGLMNLHVHTETLNGRVVHMVSAPMPKVPGGVNGGGLRYGRYVIRFRSDALRGYKIAWMLWPDTEIWPQDGEIDFPEGDLDGSFSAFMHHMGASSGTQQDAYPTNARYTSWHTASLDWRSTSCRFTLDGNVIGTSYNHLPSTPMHWVLQTETTLDGTIPSNATAGNVQIDWVAAYTPA